MSFRSPFHIIINIIQAPQCVP